MRNRIIPVFVVFSTLVLSGCGGGVDEAKFTVTWKNYDGTILEVDKDVPNGTLPTYDGELPKKVADDHVYTFANWNPEIIKVTGDQTYVAVFSESGNLEYTYYESTKSYSLAKATLPKDELVAVDIPSSYNDGTNGVHPVTEIEYGAFAFCSSLAAVSIPNTITWIAGAAFEACTSLTSVIIPDSVTTIDGSTFTGCTSLTSATLPTKIDTIPMFMFDDCVSLLSITIPKDVTKINQNAFYGCRSLTLIAISKKVTTIGMSAFAFCTSLSSIVVEEGNPTYHSSNNCLIETATKTLLAGCKSSIIPSDGSVETIESEAFAGSSIVSIDIPFGVTSIGNYAFQGCESLVSVNISGSVTSIGNYTFDHCSSLISVTIPNSVTSIGYQTFGYCSSLKYLYVESGNPVYHSSVTALSKLGSRPLFMALTIQLYLMIQVLRIFGKKLSVD